MTYSDKLRIRRIRRTIPAHPWLEHLHLLDEADSTNTCAKKLASGGAPAGTVVLAERQTAGRGRLGHSFLSPAGGLYMSVILRPEGEPERCLHLTACAAVAAMRAIEETTGVRTQIKWPNDLLCGEKKVCGILTERSGDAVILGIGINCNQTEFDPSIAGIASSLRLETGRPVDRSALAGNLIHMIYALSLTLFTHKENWLRRYRDACLTPGHDVSLLRGDTAAAAHADGIGENGELLVTYPDGTKDTVTFGEVSVRGLYGNYT